MIKGVKDLLDVKIMLIVAAFFTVLTFLSSQTQVNSKVLTGAVFTEGIEGPSVDKNGDLYLVNFHHEGSIGIIKKGKKHHNCLSIYPKEVLAMVFDSMQKMKCL